ncbi:MgtC/SapB family protein [Tropicimonas sp. S265A]|uniref:MgtC/SapB family protein n=1 Tax=Tropicimonas sp. S265A TaxID=3415134 RepID=UPI003C7DDAB9
MIDYSEFLVRVGAAAFCGLLVGIDREAKSKPLGARAYILTSAASAMWIIITLNFSLQVNGLEDDLNVDPTRLIQGLVGAIGFLGAGAIISTTETGRLRGVASGAAIWGVGAIGVACGMGFVLEALTLSVGYVVVLNLYDWIVGDEDDASPPS